jgi:hypothetical protein
MIDRCDAKLMHEVQQFDVTVLEFESVFCGHGGLAVILVDGAS